MNHFELFDLPQQFTLDAADLQQRYRQLQQKLHPDRFANSGERDKLVAVQRSAQLNDAYQTLRKPLSRAEYILTLRGIDLRHEQQTIKDPEFLMAQMEWRERIEAVAQSHDQLAEVAAAEQDLVAETNALQKHLEDLLEHDDAEHNEAAANQVRKLKFMHKLRAELERIEEQAF